MGIFDNLDDRYGDRIHGRHWQALVSGANNLVMGSSVKLCRMAKQGSLEAYYVRKLDGLTWKEDFALAATSLLWSLPAFAINLTTVALAPAMTFLSGVVLGLSALFPFQSIKKGSNFFSHAAISLAQAVAVIAVGVPLMTLSATLDVVRAIPVVGHLFRMVYKLLDGQYKKPRLPGLANLVAPEVAPAGEEKTEAQPLRTRELVRVNIFDQFAQLVMYPGFTLFFAAFNPAPASEAKQQDLRSFENTYARFAEPLAELSLGNEFIAEGDLMAVCDLMSALQRIKDYQSGSSLTLLFNARSEMMSGRVNAVEFIAKLNQNASILNRVQQACTDAGDTKLAQSVGVLKTDLAANLQVSTRAQAAETSGMLARHGLRHRGAAGVVEQEHEGLLAMHQ